MALPLATRVRAVGYTDGQMFRWRIKEEVRVKTFQVLLTLGLAVPWLACSLCDAGEPGPFVDSVLSKWEDASLKCKTLDAKLTIYQYDNVFDGNQPVITYGRFYYEAPNLGRYEIGKSPKRATNDWSSVSEAVIWTGKDMLWIEGDTRRCRKFSAATLQSFLSQPRDNRLGWLPEFARGFAWRFQGPKQFYPLLIGISASEIRERFHVTLKKGGEDIFVGALPKRSADAARYSSIDVILSVQTYMTVATQTTSPDGRQRTVIELSDTMINQRPNDRDQLLAPDLAGLHVTDDR